MLELNDESALLALKEEAVFLSQNPGTAFFPLYSKEYLRKRSWIGIPLDGDYTIGLASALLARIKDKELAVINLGWDLYDWETTVIANESDIWREFRQAHSINPYLLVGRDVDFYLIVTEEEVSTLATTVEFAENVLRMPLVEARVRFRHFAGGVLPDQTDPLVWDHTLQWQRCLARLADYYEDDLDKEDAARLNEVLQ